jgi:hypothetical protein
MERSAIRELHAGGDPDFASLHPGYELRATGHPISAKSSLATMVNRVLTSPYLWWFDPFPGRSRRAIGCPRVLAL